MSEQTTRAEELLKQVGDIPSERDWEIYRHVKVECSPIATTAEKLVISQQQVRASVKRVGEFVLTLLPLRTKEDEVRQLAASKQLAAERLEHLIGEVMRCFHRSKGEEKIVRQPHGSGKTPCTTTRMCHGDMRYLRTASYLMKVAATLPPPLVCGGVVDAQFAELLEPAERKAPTKEDCSAPPVEPVKPEEHTASAPSATVAAMLSCVEQSRAENAGLNDETRPVQGARRKPLTNGQAMRREAFFQT